MLHKHVASVKMQCYTNFYVKSNLASVIHIKSFQTLHHNCSLSEMPHVITKLNLREKFPSWDWTTARDITLALEWYVLVTLSLPASQSMASIFTITVLFPWKFSYIHSSLEEDPQLCQRTHLVKKEYGCMYW